VKRLGKKQQGDISPDLTSFSDIANLLIIFFILTTTFAKPWGREMQMPAASTPPASDQKNNDTTPTVNITVDRILFAEGEGKEREVTMNEFRQEMFKREFTKKDEKSRVVILETAAEVPYERYYRVASTIAEAGGVIAIVQD